MHKQNNMSMKSEILVAVVGLICTAISSLITFLLTRRKYNTEVDNQQIRNMSESFEAYKKMVKETLDLQNEKIKTLEQENKSLREQVSLLQKQLADILMVKVSKTVGE